MSQRGFGGFGSGGPAGLGRPVARRLRPAPAGGPGQGGHRHGGHGGPPPWVAGLFGLAQGERARPAGPPRRRAGRDPRRARAPARGGRAGQRLPGHPADRRAQRRRLAPEPRARSTRPSSSSRTRGWSRPTTSAAAAACGSPPRARRTSPSTPTSWPPCGRRSRPGRERGRGEFAGLKPEIGQVMGAVWQIVTRARSAAARGRRDPRRDPAQALRRARRRRRPSGRRTRTAAS